MKFKFILLFTTLATIGCSSKVWQQPGKSNAQMHADLADCRTRAAQLVAPLLMDSVSSRISAHYTQEDYLRDCMLGKGYELHHLKLASPATH